MVYQFIGIGQDQKQPKESNHRIVTNTIVELENNILVFLKRVGLNFRTLEYTHAEVEANKL